METPIDSKVSFIISAVLLSPELPSKSLWLGALVAPWTCTVWRHGSYRRDGWSFRVLENPSYEWMMTGAAPTKMETIGN